MNKIGKKLPNFALGGQFWFQSDFFCKPPPIRLRPRREPMGTKNFESPLHQKKKKKKKKKTLVPKLRVNSNTYPKVNYFHKIEDHNSVGND